MCAPKPHRTLCHDSKISRCVRGSPETLRRWAGCRQAAALKLAENGSFSSFCGRSKRDVRGDSSMIRQNVTAQSRAAYRGPVESGLLLFDDEKLPFSATSLGFAIRVRRWAGCRHRSTTEGCTLRTVLCWTGGFEDRRMKVPDASGGGCPMRSARTEEKGSFEAYVRRACERSGYGS